MNVTLTDVEIRVLGSLIEKELSTPEYYPLSLNALVAACNQKNNRDPVVEYDEKTVIQGLDGLREKQLAYRIDLAGSRVAKYKHALSDRYPLTRQQVALLCTLLLRGPQTVGELRGRSERIFPFRDLSHVEETLQSLIDEVEEPLVILLPKQPGRKEARYFHLFGGTPVSNADGCASPSLPSSDSRPSAPSENIQGSSFGNELAQIKAELLGLQSDYRILQERVADLEASIADLQQQLALSK